MKKIISLLLAVIMVASLLPVMVFADPIKITTAGGSLSVGEYVLNDDVDLTVNLTIDVGADNTVTIDLKGHVLKGAGTGSVITVRSGTLILNDSVSTTEHTGYVDVNGLWHWDKDGTYDLQTGETSKTITGGVITGGKNSGIKVKGTLNMNNGSIAGNTTANNGGGVVVSGTFNMNGGTIENCTATGNTSGNGMGGGVFVDDNKEYIFNINGGVIQDCFAKRWGGGVANQGTMTITKGAIQRCTADGAGGVNNDRVFTMYGGTIEGCKALGEDANDPKWYSGGIRFANSGRSDAKVMIGGDAKIINNTRKGDVASNLYLETDKTVTLGTGTGEGGNDVAAPTNGFSVGILKGDRVGKFTENAKEDYAKYFFSDNPAYYVDFVTDHLELKELPDGYHIIKVKPSEYGSVTADKPIALAEEIVTLTITLDDGYQLKTLKYNDGTDHDITKDATTGNYQFAMPGYAVTVTAEFELIPEPEPERKSYTTVTIGGNKDKEETKAEETSEENPDTGAPVMNLGAVAVVFGAAFVLSKKH